MISTLTDADHDQTVQQLLRPLLPFLEPHTVTEVTLNQAQELWIKERQGWTRQDVPELTLPYLQSLATALIVYNGLQAKSIVSVILPEGQRGQIVLPPACLEGTLSLSIRKHAPVVKTLEQLAQEGAFKSVQDVSFHQPSLQDAKAYLTRHDFTRLEPSDVELLTLKYEHNIQDFLQQAVRLKRNIIVAGKTGSGKTTFARSLIEKVPTTERLITIEDVHELFLEHHPNRVHLIYGDGEGRVSADDCLKCCLRQSPDRIFLAELRGSEAWEYLNSLNTGHPGSITTTHANSALHTFERVATLIKKSEVGQQLDRDLIKQILYTTLDVVIFLQDRQVTEIFYDPIFARSKVT